MYMVANAQIMVEREQEGCPVSATVLDGLAQV